MLTKEASRRINYLIEQLCLSHTATLHKGEKINNDDMQALAALISSIEPTIGEGIGVIGFLAGDANDTGGDDE
ncbi:hypothetical protein [Brevibacillus parabrevis]|jgi:hypothetical protein|uniref:hypothetical protein n=1 Tax=Brevibacillus parabrevis TaxID=54914 RepID=UPI00248F47C1|nr:hypothetical protein [Brevibacillus parabrevis]